MSRKDFLDHATRQLGDQNVKHRRRITALVGQACPIQIVGLPGLRHQSAGVTHEGGERLQIEEFTGIGLSERRMRHAKISRYPLAANLLGKPPRKLIELLPGSPRVLLPPGESPPELCRQVEGICRRQMGKRQLRMTPAKSFLDLLRLFG